MKQSMSVSFGAVAGRKHNVEVEYRTGLRNVSPERMRLNEVLVDEDLGEVYHELFGDALEDYNRKQAEKGHSERVIDDYLEKIRSGKQEKPSYEMVVQIGNRDTNSATDEANRAGSSLIYRDFLREFKERFPQLRVYQAAVHMDEATPHLHVCFVPVSKGNKRGLATKNSLSGAWRQMGYGDSREAGKQIAEVLSEVAKKRGVERLDVGCHRAHLTVRDYKAAVEGLKTQDERIPPVVSQLLLEQQKMCEEALEAVEQTVDMMDETLGTISGLVEGRISKSDRARIREEIADAKEACESLRGQLEPARKAQSRFKGFIAEIPDWWRDHVIIPVTDALRAARERFEGDYDDRRRREAESQPAVSTEETKPAAAVETERPKPKMDLRAEGEAARAASRAMAEHREAVSRTRTR